ncbi:hypothetical protein HID58_019905 [Brassica napus]|uniref:RBR-type E3 ubiquitin transferase n=1 Tax=Brassica napus TaxID=3708 RepID=A0A816TV46_BRANA|nr:hypothetical protein HID58_019905 [Brassica napus]CAF2102579.1 unnamed protein product [Brassica napus]
MGTCFSSSSSSTSRTRMVDYYYDPALYDYNRVFPPCDVNYVKNLHRQEALASSLVTSMEEEINHHPQPQRHVTLRIKHEEEEPEIKTENEPVEPSSMLCMICMDEKSPSDMFRGNCTHSYCTECTVRYVETKIGENVAGIKCPDVDCTHLIEPNTCRDLIPRNLMERWDKALCELLFMSSGKVYCPFENCSAMMVVEGGDDKVTLTECPSCHRLFCAQCKVTWHEGIGCKEFQRVGNTKKKCRVILNGILNIAKGKEKKKNVDKLLIQLAKKKQWRRCPSCNFYVEKLVGCMHISCRCGFEFCYGCGSKWGYRHSCLSTRSYFMRSFLISFLAN